MTSQATKVIHSGPKLTWTPKEKATIGETYEGMAHFAGTGPAGRMCGQCEWFRQVGGKKSSRVPREVERSGFVRHSHCLKCQQLKRGSYPKIPSIALACKYFEERK